MHVVAYEEAPIREVDRSEGRAVVRNYLGTVMEMGVGPQAFLAEFAPGARVSSHFHDIDQFQVFVKGRGRFGKDAWQVGTFHYADAFTPYGPIVPEAGSEMAFFTLRQATSSGYHRMPDARYLLGSRRGRNVVSLFEPQDPASAASGNGGRDLLTLAEDDVRVEGLHLAPDAPLPSRGPQAAGQYFLVLSGSLQHEGKPLQPLSLIFVEAGEEISGVLAGAQGARILRLQFPRPSAREGSDPKLLAARDMSGDYALPENYR